MSKQKKIKITPFKNLQVIRLSNSLYVNTANENTYIKYNGVKYYKTKKSSLKKLGMKFEDKPKVTLTEEELEIMKQNLINFLNKHEAEIGELMVENGYKVVGINC